MAIATINPINGEVVKEFEAHDEAEVERRLALAQSAFDQLKSTTYAQRAAWLVRAAEILEADVDNAAAMLVLEMGKPIGQARGEVLKSAKGLRFYAEHAANFMADDWLADPSAVGAKRAGAKLQPLGVVLAVMPWNYPLWQALRFAAPALAAGNVGLLKHASNVPQSALLLDELFTKAGFPAGAFQALLIPARDVKAVIEDPRVKAVTLTGSEPAGRNVAEIAGNAIKKTVLELGGSDPFIVLPSADLEAAADAAVRARLLNNGQSCIAGKRFIAHTDIYDKFAELFATKMAAIKMGDPMDPDTVLGPLATESGRDEVAGLVDDAVAKGAKLLAGGVVPDQAGWWYPATLLADLPDDALLVMEEAFGPVASLYRAKDIDDAIRIANQTRFGLSSAVWTNSEADEQKCIEEIEAGAVFINGITASYPELPFGGVKASGYGRELAAVGMREFTNLKTVWKG